jgi:hypothetical protein
MLWRSMLLADRRTTETCVRTRWQVRDIKVGDVLLSVDGKEPESLREALDVSVIALRALRPRRASTNEDGALYQCVVLKCVPASGSCSRARRDRR